MQSITSLPVYVSNGSTTDLGGGLQVTYHDVVFVYAQGADDTEIDILSIDAPGSGSTSYLWTYGQQKGECNLLNGFARCNPWGEGLARVASTPEYAISHVKAVLWREPTPWVAFPHNAYPVSGLSGECVCASQN